MTYCIEVVSGNAVSLKLSTDNSIKQELNEYFSFMAPNYRFMPAYKSGKWDGKIRLYSHKTSKMPVGLFDVLCKFADERDYDIIDKRENIPNPIYNNDRIDQFLYSLDVQSGGNDIEFRDYQKHTIKTVVNACRSTIQSSTSSGKSLVIYALVRLYLKMFKGADKILLITPTIGLVTQMKSDFEDYSVNNGWDVEANVHQIYDNAKKHSEKQVFIATWQSLHRMPKKYFESFKFVMFDEVHLATATSVVKIMNNCVNANYRVGVTGTLKDAQLHQLTLTGLFGTIKKVTNTRDLIDAGYLSKLKVKIIILKYNNIISKMITDKVKIKDEKGEIKIRNNYQNEMDFIAGYGNRNRFILKLASVLKGNVLVLFSKVEKHGKPLYKMFHDNLGNDRNIFYISGETSSEKREQIRNDMDRENDSILVGSYGTMSTGVNIKNLNYVILAHPHKSKVKVLQSIGRVLRVGREDRGAVVFDLVDDLTYKSRKNYCYRHFMARLSMYENEKFPMVLKKHIIK